MIKKTTVFYEDERGNVFTTLLGAIALMGMLSASTFYLLSGPLTTAARMSFKTQVSSQMQAITKMLIVDATNQASSGDCDADSFIEPREWRAGSGPTGGGLVPLTVGAPVTDPWGTDYGYCVWDTGPLFQGVGCGGAGELRLDGADNPFSSSAETQTVLAVVSAGPDKSFATTCADYVDSGTDVLTAGGDDIVLRYTYLEAGQTSPVTVSSLWTLKAGAPDTAVTDKNISLGGGDVVFDASSGALGLTTATTAIGVTTTGRVIATGGAVLGDETDVITCNGSNIGLLRYDTGSSGIQACNGSVWGDLGGGGGAPATNGLLENESTVTVCASGDEGGLRYNTVSKLAQVCDGTQWKTFVAPELRDGEQSLLTNGYLVMSGDVYTGDFGGLSGANAVCLSDLTNNFWAGKDDAVFRGLLISAKVKAFLCDGTTCNVPTASKAYVFNVAVSDEEEFENYGIHDIDIPASQPGYKVLSKAGLFNGLKLNWDDLQAYFDGSVSFWVGNWMANASCNDWTSSLSSNKGTAGKATDVELHGYTWWKVAPVGCDQFAKLMCLVNP